MALILVADDDPIVRTLIRILIEKNGHTAIEAADGLGALALYGEHRPHLAIVDMVMPHMDGLSLVRRIRERDSRTPILAISCGKKDYLAAARTFENIETLEKPFAPEMLLGRIETSLSRGFPWTPEPGEAATRPIGFTQP